MLVALFGNMGKRLMLMTVLATVLMLSTAYAATEARWHGKLLVQIGSKADLPTAVRSLLHMDDHGMAGVADIGGQFNAGDAHVVDWPDRALIGAGHIDNHWIVVLVRNGGQSAPLLWLYEFEGSMLLNHKQLRFWKGHEDTFAAVVAEAGGIT